jgi:hypothetical protein
MKSISSHARNAAVTVRDVAIGALIVISANLAGCPVTPTKLEQPAGNCSCPCDATRSKSDRPCSADPLDEPAPHLKSSIPL